MEKYSFRDREHRVFPFVAYGRERKAIFENLHYSNGSLAVTMFELDEEGPEPWATVTVNLPSAGDLPDGHQFLDTENCSCWGVTSFLEDNGLAEPTGLTVTSGFCTFPLYRFHTEKFCV